MLETLRTAWSKHDGSVGLSVCLHQGGPRWIDAFSDGRVRGRVSGAQDPWRTVDVARLDAVLEDLTELKPGPLGSAYTVQVFSDAGDWEVHTDDAAGVAGKLERLLSPVAETVITRLRRFVRPLLLPVWMLPAGLFLVAGLSGDGVLMAVFGGIGLAFALAAAAATALVFKLR